MILVTGATGFVGREVVRQLVEAGQDVRILARDEEKVKSLSLLTGRNKFEVAYGDITDLESVKAAAEGCSAVINLVGIIGEFLGATFDKIHLEGTENTVEAAKAAGVQRFLQMSAINTRPNAASRYHQTKFAAEEVVRQSGLEWTIFQPSVIYGAEDGFTNLFATFMKFPANALAGYTLPCMDGGKNAIQPVHVSEVAYAFTRAIANPASIGKTYELVGDSITMREFLETLADVQGLKRIYIEANIPALPFLALISAAMGYQAILLSVPSLFMKVAAAGVEYLTPLPMPSLDQVTMLGEEHRGDAGPAAADLGFHTGDFREGISEYLKPADV